MTNEEIAATFNIPLNHVKVMDMCVMLMRQLHTMRMLDDEGAAKLSVILAYQLSNDLVNMKLYSKAISQIIRREGEEMLELLVGIEGGSKEVTQSLIAKLQATPMPPKQS